MLKLASSYLVIIDKQIVYKVVNRYFKETGLQDRYERS